MAKEPKAPQTKPETRETDPEATYKRLEDMTRKILQVPKSAIRDYKRPKPPPSQP